MTATPPQRDITTLDSPLATPVAFSPTSTWLNFRIVWNIPEPLMNLQRVICCSECTHASGAVFRLVARPCGKNITVYVQCMNIEHMLGPNEAYDVNFETSMKIPTRSKPLAIRSGVARLQHSTPDSATANGCADFAPFADLERQLRHAIKHTANTDNPEEFQLTVECRLFLCKRINPSKQILKSPYLLPDLAELSSASSIDLDSQSTVACASSPTKPVSDSPPQEHCTPQKQSAKSIMRPDPRVTPPQQPSSLQTDSLRRGDCVVIRADEGYWIARVLSPPKANGPLVNVKWFELQDNLLYKLTESTDRVALTSVHPVPVTMTVEAGGLFRMSASNSQSMIITKYYGSPL